MNKVKYENKTIAYTVNRAKINKNKKFLYYNTKW